jgi:hypothetical protein
MTPFVISLAKPYLKYMNTSLIDYGHPHGLIALTIVSVSLSFLGCFCLSNNTYSWNMHFGLSKLGDNIVTLAHLMQNTRPSLRSISRVWITSPSGTHFIWHATLLGAGLVMR